MTGAVVAASILLALWLTARLALGVRFPQHFPLAPPRAHGGAGEPRTTTEVAHETGARRLTVRDRILARLIPATGCHAEPLALRRGRNGLLRNSEDPTGEQPALDDSMFEVTP